MKTLHVQGAEQIRQALEMASTMGTLPSKGKTKHFAYKNTNAKPFRHLDKVMFLCLSVGRADVMTISSCTYLWLKLYL